MSTVPIPALLRDLDDLQHLRHSETHRPSRKDIERIEDIVRAARECAASVRRDWSRLPDDRRDALRAFAYRETSGGGRVATVWFYVRGVLWLASITVRGQFSAVHALAEAFGELREAVLDAIEREHPAYRERALAAVKHAVRPSDARTVETPEEIDRWLAELSDKADRRV